MLGFEREKGHGAGPIMRRVAAVYGELLSGAIARPLSTLMVFVGVSLAALALIPQVKTELMPAADQGEVIVTVDLAIGTPLDETDRVAQRVSAALEKIVSEAVRIGYTAGSPGWWSSRTGDTARVNVVLPKRHERPRATGEVVGAILKEMPKIPGVKVRARPGGGLFLLRFLRGGSGEDRLELEVRGTDLDQMQAFATEAAERLRKVPGVQDLRPPRLRGRDEIAMTIDAQKAALNGLNAERLGQELQTYLRGRKVTRLRTTVEEVPVILRLAEEDRAHVGQISKLLVRAPRTGAAIPVRRTRDADPAKRADGHSPLQRSTHIEHWRGSEWTTAR